MKLLRKIRWGEAFLWAGFVISIAFISDEGMDAITAMGVFAIAAIGVRATRSYPSLDTLGGE